VSATEKTTSFGELRRAAASFFCALCLGGMAAFFWYGDTGLFHYLAVLPALFALLLVYNGFHALLASSTPPTTVELPPHPLKIGRSVKVIVRQFGPAKLSSLRANLVCERIEKFVKRSRRITFPHQINFLDRPACELMPNETKAFEATLAIPEDAEPSCVGVSLDVLWRIEVWGKVIGGADFMRPFEIEVVE
jgi:hypothetical protein